MSYTDYIPEIGEAQYEAEQAMMALNAADEFNRAEDKLMNAEFAKRPNAKFVHAFVSEWYEENEAMRRSEESYEPARQAHLMGAW